MSPHRTARPWQGQVEEHAIERRPTYDPGCYLCPGNARAGGARTPQYESIYVDNDFAALKPDTPPLQLDVDWLLVAHSERGTCRVVCFSPRHDHTLGEMTLAAIARVVDTWTDQYAELGNVDWVNHVLVFENRGAMSDS